MDRENNTERNTNSSAVSTDSLLGGGHTPNYGLVDSQESRPVYSESETPHWHVVALYALTACVASMVAGMSLSFSSIIINELNTSETVDPNWQIDTNGIEASLIGALVPIGGIFGGLCAWPVSDSLGRQAALMIGGIPGLIGWLLISLSILFSSKLGFFLMVYIGRVLSGFSTAWSVYCVSVYIAEIASAKRKGRFGNCNQFFITIGILFSYILGIEFNGKRASFSEVALVAAGLITLFEAMMLLTYETPRWLFGKNKDFLGIKVLKHLRGPDAQIMREIDRIKAALRRTYSVVEQLNEFRSRSVYLPFILVIMLMFFQQFSGINAAIFYSSNVFKQAGYKGNTVEIIAAGAVGGTQIFSTFLSVLLIDHLGRRVLLILSSIGMMLGSIVLSVYFEIYTNVHHCDAENHTETNLPPDTATYCHNIGYVAIVAVIFFIASFSIGWGPIPWTGMSELLPNKVRGLAGSLGAMSNWIFATVITLGFIHYANAVTPKIAWASFAFIMFLSIICVFLFLPETKGHSLEEIQENFERGRIFAIRFGGGRRGGRGSPDTSHASHIN